MQTGPPHADDNIESCSSCGNSNSDRAEPSRRSFFGGLLVAGGAGVAALLGLPVIKFVLHPLLAKTTEKSWSNAGSVEEFKAITAPVKKIVQIEQLDGWRKTISEKPIYVTKDAAGQLIVLSAICTHLGCTVPWVDKENKFICPCHQAVFDPAGKLLGGPAPRSMDRLNMKVEAGIVKVEYQFFRQLTPDKEVLA